MSAVVGVSSRYGIFSCYSLDGNGITDKGFGILAKALKVNKSLESLRSVTALHSVCAIVVIGMFFNCCSLDGKSIRDKGAGMLADALKVNQSLVNLRSVTVLYLVYVMHAGGM